MSDTDLMKAFADSTDANFYIKDAEGRYLWVNRKAAALLGLSAADCVGKTAYDFVPKEPADRATRADRQVSESGVPAKITHVASFPTGQHTLLDHKFPVSLPDHPGATGGISFEVTDAE